MKISNIFTIFFLNILVMCCIACFLSSNPVYSLLFLILNYCIIGGLFIVNQYVYFGLTFILIYAGAVSILLIFTLMLLNLKIVYYRNFKRSLFSLILFAVLSLELFFIFYFKEYFEFSTNLSYSVDWFFIDSINSDLVNISTCLYFENSFLVFFSSIFLLMSLIASVNIVNSLKDSTKQQSFIQLKKYSKNFIK